MCIRWCMSLRFKEQAWAGDINLGIIRLEILIKPRKLDKISKRIGIDGEDKRLTESWNPDTSKPGKRKRLIQRAKEEQMDTGWTPGAWSSGAERRKHFKENKAKATSRGADKSDQTVTQSRPREASPDGIGLSRGTRTEGGDWGQATLSRSSVVKGCRDVGWKPAGYMRSREFLSIYSQEGRRNSMYNGC